MEIPAIREVLRARPFRPFVFRLADGRAMAVPHPEFAAIAGRTVFVANAAQDGTFSDVDSLLIVSIDYSGATVSHPNGEGGT
jgi:hypothetical protein